MGVIFFARRIDFLHATALGSLLVLLVTHLPASYESYQIRKRVRIGFDVANIAKDLVVTNALNRRSLGFGWTESISGGVEGVRIHQDTGHITVTFTENSYGGSSLVLIPVYKRNGRYFSLADEVNTRQFLVIDKISWICFSNLVRTDFNGARGTLPVKYAPAICRLPRSLKLSE